MVSQIVKMSRLVSNIGEGNYHFIGSLMVQTNEMLEGFWVKCRVSCFAGVINKWFLRLWNIQVLGKIGYKKLQSHCFSLAKRMDLTTLRNILLLKAMRYKVSQMVKTARTIGEIEERDDIISYFLRWWFKQTTSRNRMLEGFWVHTSLSCTGLRNKLSLRLIIVKLWNIQGLGKVG